MPDFREVSNDILTEAVTVAVQTGSVAAGLAAGGGTAARHAVNAASSAADRGVKRAIDAISSSASDVIDTPSTTTTTSTRRGDDEFHRGLVDGNAVLVNMRRNKPVKFVLGPSIACNNTDFYRQMINRSTSVSTQGGYVYTAGVGKRVWNMFSFRHNIFNPTPSTPFDYSALTAATLILPTTENQYVHGNDGPQIKNPYREVSAASGIGIENSAP